MCSDYPFRPLAVLIGLLTEATTFPGQCPLITHISDIDRAGILVTPVERDFERVDAAAVEGIYKEVSLEGEVVEKGIRPLGKAQRA